MTGLDPSATRALAWPGEPQKPVEDCTPEEARKQYLDGFSRLQWPLEPVGETIEQDAGGIRVKIWRGQDAQHEGAPALLYLHGGGFVIGAPETHEDICRILANAAGAVVVSPDYRLAPEHPFPAAIEDCAATLHWMKEQAASLGIDATRIVVAGDSAGGNLAAVIALLARDRQVPAILGQVLIYPVTDQQQASDSYRRYATDFGLTAEAMRWFRDHYMPDENSRMDWRASPLLVPSLQGVAPAFVVLAGHDVLFDEGLAYAKRLEAEASARCRIWPGQIHGFVSMGRAIPEAREALDAILDAWRGMDPRLGT
ncbi:lipase [Shinella sumterensis]|uniref:alpha/beta hydrolase n=1 Tax=Shinella sumterensis TaxID=1967501 RepID=UPI00106E7ABC|nr:alpha/beta hydrolase [Shinella sumterensis]MCD1266251.1 alpha/beta hydrolase fold domain-containing protein [Shinella sumterensis]TFE96939.1 lipase [Shinella sumterensis]